MFAVFISKHFKAAPVVKIASHSWKVLLLFNLKPTFTTVNCLLYKHLSYILLQIGPEQRQITILPVIFPWLN